MVSKCLSRSYLRTISSVMATRSGFMGCAKAQWQVPIISSKQQITSFFPSIANIIVNALQISTYIIPNLYIMDNEEFGELEQASSPPQASSPADPHQDLLAPQPPLPVEDEQDSPLSQPSMQASYSLDTGFPSEQTSGQDTTDWQASPWPELGKMESDHPAAVEHLALDFGKRHSEGEVPGQAADYLHGLKLTREVGEAESNISNAATLNSQPIWDLDFGSSPSKPSEPHSENHSSSPQKTDPGSAAIQFQQGKPLQNVELSQIEKTEEPQHKESDEFEEFKEAEPQTVKKEEEEEEEEKEEDELEYQEASQPQERAVAREVVPQDQTVIEEDDFLPSFPQQSSTTEVKTQAVVQPEAVWPEQPVQQEELKPAEIIRQEPAPEEDEDEDEFGDFQETAPATTIQVEASEPMGTQQVNGAFLQEPELQVSLGSNTVRMDESGQENAELARSKLAQLQAFVEGLPDYSYLLSCAFSSL